MPTPIQSSSVTAKLRSFFRLRGRQIFTLDETVVPTAQVEDLTSAPYRANHQVRWKASQRFIIDTLAGRRFMVIVNLSQVTFMNTSDVPGVGVVEELELQTGTATAPDGARTWIAFLVNHLGVLGSVEPAAVITIPGTDVDSAFAVPVPAMGVGGRVPVRLSGVQQNLAPDLGVRQRIAGLRLEDAPPGTPMRFLGCEQVTIGDNVCIVLLNDAAATSGLITVNVSGSYYPLARS